MALRNRWRRQQLGPELRDEVTPKNILMIGPTGCGKTEISRRLAKLADAPFVKVEATKFTEVGYVGRDVEQIARDLVEEAVRLERERRREAVRTGAEEAAMERLLDALTGKGSSAATRESFRQRYTDGSLNDAEVEIEVHEAPSMPFEIPGMGGQVGMINLSDMMGKAFGNQPGKRRKLKVPDAFQRLTDEEADKRVDPDDINRVALADAEANGIVFLDEIDKIAVSDVRGGSVSREGVQRDLLPLIEGTTVATKYGPLKTDHILFIASGAFHIAKPADLLPELQGRLPIRVELSALTQEDFVRILSQTRASLTQQYQALLGTEGVTVDVRRRRHRGARPHRRRGERGGREYRRAAASDGDGEIARGRQLRGGGPQRRDARRRRGIRRPAARGHRQERRSQPLRAVIARSFAACREPRTAHRQACTRAPRRSLVFQFKSGRSPMSLKLVFLTTAAVLATAATAQTTPTTTTHDDHDRKPSLRRRQPRLRRRRRPPRRPSRPTPGQPTTTQIHDHPDPAADRAGRSGDHDDPDHDDRDESRGRDAGHRGRHQGRRQGL